MDITVTLSDGRRVEVDTGTTARDALRAGGARNLRDVVAARIDGRVIDLSRPLAQSCGVESVTADSPDGTEVLRHSAAHLMAQAVKRLFPDTQVTIGPVIEDGFYYDFKKADDHRQRLPGDARGVAAPRGHRAVCWHGRAVQG
jgi:threonyl-tRNA synthetase